MIIEEAFGLTLQDLRKARKLSQEELGFESGYHRTYISQLERGRKSPSLRTIFHLAAALNMLPSEVVLRVEKSVFEQSNGNDRKGEGPDENSAG